jgi:hypothetical protein
VARSNGLHDLDVMISWTSLTQSLEGAELYFIVVLLSPCTRCDRFGDKGSFQLERKAPFLFLPTWQFFRRLPCVVYQPEGDACHSAPAQLVVGRPGRAATKHGPPGPRSVVVRIATLRAGEDWYSLATFASPRAAP